LEKASVSIALHLVQLATNLLQRAQLGLETDIMITAFLHLLLQIFVQFGVLFCGLSRLLSCIGFLFCGTGELCLLGIQHRLIVCDSRLEGLRGFFAEAFQHRDIIHELIPLVLDPALDC
jgi:hypothetical protein